MLCMLWVYCSFQYLWQSLLCSFSMRWTDAWWTRDAGGHCQGRVMLSWDFLEVPTSPLISQISDPKSVSAIWKFYPLYLDKEISALASLCLHGSAINSPVIC